MGSSDAETKACCADFYQNEMVRLLLGDVLHPGGLELTGHLGDVLRLQKGERVLDIACGRGSSAAFIAERFGCHVTGVDYSNENIVRARARVEPSAVSHLTSFEPGDAEALPFDDQQFDAVISECSLCTFPNKDVAAREMSRVVRPGGRVGITDVTASRALPDDIQSAVAWVACIAGAGASSQYVSLLAKAGFDDFVVEDRSDDAGQMVADMRRKLSVLELAAKLSKVQTGNLDLEGTRDALKRAEHLIDSGVLGYVLIVARKR